LLLLRLGELFSVMRSSLARAIAALETMEAVIARLTIDHERDEVITRLLAAIEQDRAHLLSVVIGAQATGSRPRRIEGTRVTDSPG
jgi:hypothetical protein